MSDFEMPVKETKLKAEAAKDSGPDTEAVAKAEAKEKPKYDPAELLRIFDELIFAGSYSETVTIRGRLKVTFMTRSAEQMEAITQKLDVLSAALMATLVEKRNILTLCHGLVAYQGTDLRGMKFEEKLTFVSKLAAPIVGMLMMALSNFDLKVDAATKEGEANF